jgi:hypothetical protein
MRADLCAPARSFREETNGESRAMGTLILVGVVHRDPEGCHHLLRLLEEIRPRAVGVELSPFGLLWRETRSQALLEKLERLLQEFPAQAREHPNTRLIGEALRLPFEYLASELHCFENGIPLHLMDLNWISREELPLYEEEILTRENLAALLSLEGPDLGEIILAAYRRASRCLEAGGSLLEAGIRPPWSEKRGLLRESFMACRVRRLARRYERFVHVGGWIHLVRDPQGLSLAGLLRDLKPMRALLRDPW